MYEFRIERLTGTAPAVGRLNELGQENWQVVAAVAIQDGVPVVLVILSRPTKSDSN